MRTLSTRVRTTDTSAGNHQFMHTRNQQREGIYINKQRSFYNNKEPKVEKNKKTTQHYCMYPRRFVRLFFHFYFTSILHIIFIVQAEGAVVPPFSSSLFNRASISSILFSRSSTFLSRSLSRRSRSFCSSPSSSSS